MAALPNLVNPNPTLDLYRRVYKPGWQFNLQRMFRHQTRELLELGALASTWTVHSRHFQGRQMVPIEQIRGSENRAHDFDGAFRPRVWHTAERWCRVAEAWQQGIMLPPVELIRVGDIYFVRDGHHRISVAAALGAREIDAVVTAWQIDGTMPWDLLGDAPGSRRGGRRVLPGIAGVASSF